MLEVKNSAPTLKSYDAGPEQNMGAFACDTAKLARRSNQNTREDSRDADVKDNPMRWIAS